MKSLLFFSIIFLFAFTSFSQTTDAAKTEEVFGIVEVQPNPQGGMQGFFNYIVKNLKYPEDAMEQGIEGKVFVVFVIEESGKIQDESIEIHKGVYPSLDQEAIRLMKESPDWEPGRTSKDGTAVKVRMILPITFKLDSKTKKKKK